MKLARLKYSLITLTGGLLLPGLLFAEGYGVPDPRGSGNVHWRSITQTAASASGYDFSRLVGVGRVYSGTQYLGLIGGFRLDDGAQDLSFGLGLGGGFLGSTDPTDARVLRDYTNGVRIFDFPYANSAGNGYDNLCTSVLDLDPVQNNYRIAACRGMKTTGLYEVYLVKFDRFGNLDTGFGTDGIVTTGWQTGSNHAFVRGIAMSTASGSPSTYFVISGAVGTYVSSNFQPKVQAFNISDGTNYASFTFSSPTCPVPASWAEATPTNATAIGVVTDVATSRYISPVSEWIANSATGNRRASAISNSGTGSSTCSEMAKFSHPFTNTEPSFTGWNDIVLGGMTIEAITGTRRYHFVGAARTHTVSPDKPGAYHCTLFHTNTNMDYLGSGTGFTNNLGFVQLPGYTASTYDGHGITLFNPDTTPDGPKYDCILNGVVAKDVSGSSKTRLLVAGAAYNGGAVAGPVNGAITAIQTGNYNFLSAMLTDNVTSLARVSLAPEGGGDDVINTIIPFSSSATAGDMVGIGRTANTQNFAGGQLTFVSEANGNVWNVSSITGEPSGRLNHSQIWTGNKMLVWGGNDGSGAKGDGGIYDPIADTWTTMQTTNAPTARTRHSTVWDGSQMIVFGGDNNSGTYYQEPKKIAFSVANPTGVWTTLSTTGQPAARANHGAAFGNNSSGTKVMVVWGGWNGTSALNTGGIYTIGTDTWSATTTTGSPSGVTLPTTVWDPPNTRMLVYGGSTNNADSGAVVTLSAYAPGPDSWTSLTGSTNSRWKGTGAYANRYFVAFGGINAAGTRIAGAERYDIGGNSWTTATTTNQPTAREGSTSVWNGANYIVWGGFDGASRLNTGGTYNPYEDTWTATNTNAAATPRDNPKSVWTGERMAVWGGYNGTTYLGAGYQYTPGQKFLHPSRDVWTAATTTSGAAAARYRHTAIWTGKEMIVWGGLDASGNALNTGGRYDPIADSWTATNTTGAPAVRKNHTAVWASTQMIVWGGSNTVSDGPDELELTTGSRYDPFANSWSATNSATSPTPRDRHVAVWAYSGTTSATWTGKMIVWGGNKDQSTKSDGMYYRPDNDTWTNLAATGKLTQGRVGMAAWFDGRNFGIWGGNTSFVGNTVTDVNTGAMLDMTVNTTWTAISGTNAPTARTTQAVWTGKYVVIFGEKSGLATSTPFCTGNGATAADRGYRFDPFTGTGGTWLGMDTTSMPTCVNEASMVWTGSKMIVWGGRTSGGTYQSSGGLYDPIYNVWSAMTSTSPPTGRAEAPGIWTGKHFLLWGGSTNGGASGVLNTGNRYQR